MKQIISIVLAAALALSMAACGSAVPEQTDVPEPTAVPKLTATPESAVTPEPTAIPETERKVVSEGNKSGDYEYTAYSDGTADITRYMGGDAELAIPAELSLP